MNLNRAGTLSTIAMLAILSGCGEEEKQQKRYPDVRLMPNEIAGQTLPKPDEDLVAGDVRDTADQGAIIPSNGSELDFSHFPTANTTNPIAGNFSEEGSTEFSTEIPEDFVLLEGFDGKEIEPLKFSEAVQEMLSADELEEPLKSILMGAEISETTKATIGGNSISIQFNLSNLNCQELGKWWDQGTPFDHLLKNSGFDARAIIIEELLENGKVKINEDVVKQIIDLIGTETDDKDLSKVLKGNIHLECREKSNQAPVIG